MGKLGFSFQLQLTFSEPVHHHAFQLRCLPKSGTRQRLISSAFRVMPDCQALMTEDHFGLKHSGTTEKPHAGFSVQADGIAEVFPERYEAAGPGWTLGPYRRQTALTAPGSALASFSKALPARDVPEAVMALLAERFTYQPGSTHAATTA